VASTMRGDSIPAQALCTGAEPAPVQGGLSEPYWVGVAGGVGGVSAGGV
jgi:hypothetical protein